MPTRTTRASPTLTPPAVRAIVGGVDPRRRDPMLDERNAIPIHAFLDMNGISPNPDADFDPRETIAVAELIMGLDTMTRDQFLVYGREALQAITAAGEPRELRALLIELDQETDELER